MSLKRLTLPVVLLAAVVSAPAMAGKATVRLNVLDDQGARVPGALFVFALEDDAAQTFSIGENDAGWYQASVDLPADDSRWNLTKSVALGYLPVRISIESKAPGGEVLQEVQEMALNPAILVPPVRIAAGGSVRIDLTLGDQAAVMKEFRAARARAKQEADARRAAEAPTDGPQGAYAEALTLYGAGNLDDAIPRFRQAIEEDPANVELRVTFANVLYKAKRSDEFEQAAQSALELDSGNRDLLMMLYGSRRGRGDLDGALETLLALKESGAAGPDLLQHLDYVAKKMGRSRGAIPAYEAILEIDPANVNACVALASLYVKSDAARSDQYVTKAIELAPNESARIHYDLASELLASKGAAARAIEMLRETVEIDPGFVAAYKKLGIASWQQENYPETRRAFETYLELDPDAADRDQILEYLDQLPASE